MAFCNEDDIAKQTEDENLTLLYRGYQDILKSQNAIDFDDLLLKVYGLFIDYVFVQLKNIWTKVFDERLIHIIGR
jgi:DNA helicase-2/ATP-dependent DNA helicase PcrA